MVSVLFVVIVILSIGIYSFHASISGNTGDNSTPAEITRKLDVDDEKNRIFEGDGSLYGVVDQNDKVIVEAEWTELEFAGKGLCIASKRIGGRLLTGCIDYEGNIVVPFIYRNINKHINEDYSLYIAEADSDGSCVLYDESFTPLFTQAWDSCSVNGNELTLASGSDTFTYSFGENGLICKSADVSGEALGCGFNMNINSRVLLSKLGSSELKYIAKGVSDYLEYAYTGDYLVWQKLSQSGSGTVFTELFPDDEKITSKRLLNISDIFIYSEKTESGAQYYAVSVIAETRISYIDESDRRFSITDEYKAVVRFAESSSGLSTVSGGFIQPEPDYPERDSITAPSGEASREGE